MLTKKLFIRNATVYMVTAMMFLVFSIGKPGLACITGKKISHISLAKQSDTSTPLLVNDTGDSIKTLHELLCEEGCDEETVEVQNNSPADDIIASSVPATETPSKAVVYFSQNNTYEAPVGLYTLFCSWKYNLV